MNLMRGNTVWFITMALYNILICQKPEMYKAYICVNFVIAH